jgi:hypothetical protein
MRKTLIGGSLLAVFVLMMLPAAAAEEAKVAQSSDLLKIQTDVFESIRDKYLNSPTPQIILITLLILFLKLVRWGIVIVGGIILLIILRIIRGHNTTGVTG